MFTGIITNLGKVESLTQNENSDILLKISTKNNIERNLDIGCSIACNGICLTLLTKEISGENITFSFEASNETKEKTTLGTWQQDQLINLEFAARFGDEIGGHMVLGHVDGLAKITNIEKINDSWCFSFAPPTDLMKFIAPKCSVTINGTSLTANEVNKDIFQINIISHTFENTNFQNLKINDFVNLEIDVIARYILKNS